MAVITDTKAKIKYIKSAQKAGYVFVKVAPKANILESTKPFTDYLYLRVDHLKGTKYLFYIPYEKHISNDWPQICVKFLDNIESIVEVFDVVDEIVHVLPKESALACVDKINSIKAQVKKLNDSILELKSKINENPEHKDRNVLESLIDSDKQQIKALMQKAVEF